MSYFAMISGMNGASLTASLGVSLGVLVAASPTLVGPHVVPPTAPGVTRTVAAADESGVHLHVRDLAADDWALRRQAQQSLVDMGPSVLPVLDRLRDGETDPERLSRLERVADRVAADDARSARGLYASFVDARPSDVLLELAWQTGGAFGVDPRVDRAAGTTRVSAVYDGQPFWGVVLDLAREHGWDVEVTAHGMSVVRPPTAGPTPRTLGGPVCVQGPLAVFARGAEVDRSVSFDQTQIDPADADVAVTRRRVRYDMTAYLEPRFMVGARRFRVTLLDARDDAGNLLLAGQAAGFADAFDAGGRLHLDEDVLGAVQDVNWTAGRLRFHAPLRYPDRPGRWLTLSGRISGRVGTELRVLTADFDPDALATWHVAGEPVDVVIGEGRSAGRWQVIVRTRRPCDEDSDAFIVTSLNSAELHDAQGRPMRRGAVRRRNLPGGGWEQVIDFAAADPGTVPARLTCRAPTRIVDLELPFRFERLPMP